ncbi:MAG: MlaD family protein [Gaiellaceae bacterium]
MRSKPAGTLVSSPILVGAVTVLVTLVAVFLAYNANEGLPFVPTFDVQALVPNGSGLVQGNEVRIGGKRVGIVKSIEARAEPRRPIAVIHMSLDKRLVLRTDSTVTIRPRSTLGLKYVQVVPGAHGRKVAQNGTLPLATAQPIVELDQVQNTLDAPTRRALQTALEDLGPGLAGRGTALNDFVAQSPQLATGVEHVARNLADPRTGLDEFVKGASSMIGELAPVTPQMERLVTSANVTAGALAGVRTQMSQVLSEAPPTESVATSVLADATPVLHDARGLLTALTPGVKVLPEAARRLHSALQVGVPVVRRAPPLVDGLQKTLAKVDEVASDPALPDSLRRLLTTVQIAGPLVSYVAPNQLKCNYLGLYWRNIASSLSEGDASGNWLRTGSMGTTDESRAHASSAPQLHENPYPNSFAPGQTPECEAGNEPYEPGMHLGNVPGNQGQSTELTYPPPGVGK